MGTLLVCGGDQRSVRRAPMDANSLERSYPERGGGTVAETTLISIVDDDKLVRKSIERLIKSSGFRVQAFAAEDFLRSGNHRDTACLILDARLPGMSGLELQRQLAASHSRVPIIFVSAHDVQEAREKALRAGAVAFLGKPFSDEALLTAVRSALE